MANKVISTVSSGVHAVSITPGDKLDLQFDTSKATFDRPADSADLVISFEEGGQAVLQDFFVKQDDAEGVPALRLADGSEVDGAEFLRAMYPDMDLSTAAGPSASSQSSGMNAYDDNSGSLIGGVDKLGALDGTPFDPQSADFSIQRLQATVFADTPGAGGGETPGAGGGETPDPTDPGTAGFYVRAALMDADGDNDPTVFMNLGNLLGGGYSGTPVVSIINDPSSNYIATYDAESGRIVISLKDPSAGPQDVENIHVTVTVDGESKDFIVQAGSSSGKDPSAIGWEQPTVDIDGTTHDVAYDNKIWVGEEDQTVTGGMTVNTPTVPAPGDEIHYQMTNSQLLAEGGNQINTVDLELNGGSYLLSNNNAAGGQSGSAFTVGHDDPRISGFGKTFGGPGGSINPAERTEYTATVQTAMGAVGVTEYETVGYEWGSPQNALVKNETAENVIDVNNGDVAINVEAAAPSFASGSSHADISATYAANGGSNTVKAAGGDIDIAASSSGITGGGDQSATVTGIRSDGAVIANNDYTTSGGFYYDRNSQTAVETDRDVSVKVTVTGDTGSQNHSNVSYAAVAATEEGQVNIKAGGDVEINAVNDATGGELATNGVFGIYAGYGLGANDLPRVDDFLEDENSYYDKEQQYAGFISSLRAQYEMGLEYEMDPNSNWKNPNYLGIAAKNVSSVTAESGKDLTVGVDLGAQNVSGESAAVKTMYGDVYLKAGEDINVNLDSRGSSDGPLSAVSHGGGHISMEAGGDVNIGISANGGDVTAFRYEPIAGSVDYAGLRGGTAVSGNNVRLAAEAGREGVTAANSATGIAASGNVYNYMTLDAEHELEISATAYDNGGRTTATGISLDAEGFSKYTSGYLTVATNSDDVTVSATVEPGTAPGGDSKASAIAANGGNLRLQGDAEDGLHLGSGPYWKETPEGKWGGVATPAIKNLTLDASGARQNIGIEVNNIEKIVGAWENKATTLNVVAENLTINAQGGAGSESYGVKAAYEPGSSVWGYWPEMAVAEIGVQNLEINAEGERAVGLSASGERSVVRILALDAIDSALNVTINCKVTGSEQLNGIAIEALQGGRVEIRGSSQFSPVAPGIRGDSIILNGDVVVAGDDQHGASYVDISTGSHNDHVEINGDISATNGGVTVFTGSGNDYVSIGGVNIDANSYVAINTVDSRYDTSGVYGNDIVAIDGKIGGSYENFSVEMGEGYDLLVLTADSFSQFLDYYGDWLQQPGILESIQCNGIIVQGMDADDIGTMSSWLSGIVDSYDGLNIDLQVYDGDGMAFINDAATMGDDFAYSGEDSLYVRFHDDGSSLQNLSDSLADKDISGLNNIVLDMVDGEAQALDHDMLSSLLDYVSENSSANVFLRADETDVLGLQDNGWTKSDAQYVGNDGNTYDVYTADEQTLYVQLITSNS